MPRSAFARVLAGEELGRTRRGPALAAHYSTFVFRGSAPDAIVLVGHEGKLEATLPGRTTSAHSLGLGDLFHCRASDADREEEVDIDIGTGRVLAPFHAVPDSRSDGHHTLKGEQRAFHGSQHSHRSNRLFTECSSLLQMDVRGCAAGSDSSLAV